MIVNILNFDHYFLQMFINSKEERNVKPKVIDPGTPTGPSRYNSGDQGLVVNH
jgi:hypothetical protein